MTEFDSLYWPSPHPLVSPDEPPWSPVTRPGNSSFLQSLKLHDEAPCLKRKQFIFTDLLMTTIKPGPGRLTPGPNARGRCSEWLYDES